MHPRTAVATLAFALHTPASAEPPPEPVHQVGEVVVTATRSEAPRERVASSVSVITAPACVDRSCSDGSIAAYIARVRLMNSA